MTNVTDSGLKLMPRPSVARPVTVEILMGVALSLVCAISVYLVWFERAGF